MQQSPPNSARFPLLSAAIVAAVAAVAAGQTVQRSDRPQAPPDDATGARDSVDSRLEPIPLEVETLGLSIHPPAGASVAAQRASGQVSIAVSEPTANPRWTMTLAIVNSSLREPTALAQIESHLDALSSREAPYEVIENKEVTINGLDGRLCYLRQTTAAGQQYISGWLVLPAGRRSFLVASSLIMPDAFADFRPTLEASFNTIEITSQEELSLRIRAQIDAGRRLLEAVTPEQLESIAESTTSQWRRIYRPSDTNARDQEIGYMVLDVFAGKRGLLTTNRHEIDYDVAEHEVGLIVRANVRVLEGRDIRDVEMLYWMAWDQGEESFSVRGTRRQGEASVSEAITGVRTRAATGEPMPTLTVITMGEYSRVRDPSRWNVPDVYLSQALNWVLPQLMANLLPGEEDGHTLAYYFFDMASAQPTLQRRVDRWEPAGTGTDNWMLTSQVGDDGQALVSYYDRAGRLIRREHPDGSRTVPIDLAELRRIWMSKNLPMSAEDLERRR